jgi:Ca2+-binding EF-hand superfamily protein
MQIPKLIPAVFLLTLAVPAVQAAGAKKPSAAPAQKPSASQPAPASQSLDSLDANHDGKISRAEWRGNDISFAMLDTNGDGAISGDEMKPSSAPAPAEESPAATFAQFDADHDGRLTRKEWPAAAADFDRMDHNHDGAVTRDEFLNLDRDRTRLESLFRMMDKNRDNRVTRAEWKGDAEDFARHDRNHDGVLTRDEYVVPK